MIYELLILLLSIIPFIENRGALFVGFALGITDPFIYILGTLLNILIVPVYLKYLDMCKYLVILKKLKLDGTVIKHGPLSFLLLIPGTANGMNAFTSSLFASSLSFDKKSSFVFIGLGIFIRGLITFTLLAGSITLAEAANIGNAFTVIMLIITISFLFPRLKEFMKDRKISIKKEYTISGFFVFLFILSLLSSQISSLLKILVDSMASGFSDGKTLGFLAFASLFFFCSVHLKSDKRYFWSFVIIILILHIMTLMSFLVYFFPLDALPIIPIYNMYAISGSHFSYTELSHIHTMKPTLIYPLIFLGIDIGDDIYDFGLVFLDYVPRYYYAIHFVLFLLAIIAALRSAPIFRNYAAKTAAIIAMFIFLKNAVDGGPFNVEFLFGIFLIYFANNHKENKRYNINIVFWAVFFIASVFSTMIIDAIHFPDFSMLSAMLINLSIPKGMVHFFSIASLILFVKFFEWKEIQKPFLALLLFVFILMAFVYGFILFPGQYYDTPVYKGNTFFFISPYQLYNSIENYSINTNNLYIIKSNESYSSVWQLANSTTERAKSKMHVNAINDGCVFDGIKNKSYFVYGNANQEEIKTKYFNITVSNSSNSNISTVNIFAHPCLPDVYILAVDFLSKNCTKCIFYYFTEYQ